MNALQALRRSHRTLGGPHHNLPETAGVAVLLAVAIVLAPPAAAQINFADINPDSSTLDPSDPDGASGGRVNGLATVPGDNQTLYAASEWGGIYKSTDGGVTWTRLDGHNPTVTWDVEVDPSTTSRVYATSFYDGRVSSLSGINVSADGGGTWSLASVPDPGGLCSGVRFAEPSAFGIAIDPDDTDNVYVGTNCGLAISTDAGASWTRVEVDEFPEGNDTDVWDVVVHDGGIIDACGDNGHHRSTDGGATWDASVGLPGGLCSIAVSPDEADVLFVAVGADVWESDDGGDTWTQLGTPDSRRQGRIPFVETNQRSDDGDTDRFDLWYGDVRLFRGECVSNPAGGGLRCPMAYPNPLPDDLDPLPGWNGPFTRSVGGHDDVGTIVFDSETAVDACPTVFSSDGGVYYNTNGASPGCHNPSWEQPTVTPHGLWLWAFTGADKAGGGLEDLYFGNQDNGTFGALDGGSASVTWTNNACCDGFDFAADASNALHTVCCGGGRANRLYIGVPGLGSAPEVNTYPADGLLPGFRPPDIVDTFGQDQFAVITRNCNGPATANPQGGCSGTNGGDGGLYITTDVTANPIVWTELGNATEPPTGGGGMCAVKAAVSGGTPTFWVQVGNCDGSSSDQLWRFDGTNAAGAWTNMTPAGGIGVFDVDPNDPERLFASILTNPPQMMLSDDGGVTWNGIPQLDALMTGNGAYQYVTNRGPSAFTGFNGYVQPSLVAFDPEDSRILAAGGQNSGVFLSTDGGSDWILVTDPDSTGGPVPHLPQPWFAYFDHEATAGGDISMYVGTRGRGVWRISFDEPPVADADGPYFTDEGVDVQLDATGSTDPSAGGSIVSYEWDFDDDGQYDDATGAMPFFDPVGDGVGQDGVYTVRLRVTDNDGLTDTDESTVTVANVAPSVVPASNSPRDENTVITVTATVTDPGWLDVLSATIDWGQGGGAVPMSLTGSENTRPNAVYTFSASYIYGDNGVFTVQVCGSDDDTSTCENIDLTILNVDPTVTIDETDIVEGCDADAFIAHAGEDVTFTGHATDPGSDDLELTWIWGDGTPDTVTDYLVNPPALDPLPSPSIQPRDVTDVQAHAFAGACLYLVTFSGLDDDGGTDSDATDVVIVGNAEQIRSAGYWHHVYRQIGRKFFTTAELECFLAMVNHLSAVFSEEVDADSIDDAEAVLDPSNGGGDITVQLDRQLLALWLNFANGAVDHDELVDTDFDDVPDTELLEVLCAAEAARLNPASTDAELETWKNILEAINLSDES